MSGEKSTKFEVAQRVSEVIGLLASHATRAEILQYAAKAGRFENRPGEPWRVSDRTVDEYIRRAWEAFEIEDERTRKKEKVRANLRFSTAYSKAMARGKFGDAVRAEQARCSLLGLNEPDRLQVEDLTWKDVAESARRKGAGK